MGTISTGTGLISGLPISDIIDKLMAIESRPVDQLKTRVETLTSQRAAFMELAARLTAMKNAVARFDQPSYFRSAKAVSSNPDVLTATAAEGTVPGTYTFRVRSLVSNHQIISRGMADRDQTPVGAGTITIELGKGAVNPTTSLAMLNDQKGVQRGTIRITDRSGRTADIDLTAAFTVNDVLDAINSRTDIGVRAAVRGDGLVLTDTSGGTGALTVADLAGRTTAADLGIAGSVSGNELVGEAVLRLGEGTALAVLNDGNGVRRAGTLKSDFRVQLGDGSAFEVELSGALKFTTRLEELNAGNGVRLGTIRITNRAGRSAEVDLAGSVTVGDVVTRINATGLVSASVNNSKSKLMIADSSVAQGQQAASNLIIEDVTGFAAQDLGIAGNVADVRIDGNTIYRVRTVGDVLRAINYAEGNEGKLRASLSADGTGIVLSDQSGGAGELVLTALNGSKAAEDLGILDARTGEVTSKRVLAGLNTVLLKSLNGGRGVREGTIQITAGDGTITQIDLSGVETVQGVLDLINSTTETSKVRAGLSSSGLGIVISDLSGGAGLLKIEDVGGGFAAADLHIATDGAARQAGGGNLQLRYIGENTALSSLNAGRGVAVGKFRITNSAGRASVIELDANVDKTVRDVLDRINRTPDAGVVARINDTGDGILLEDTAGGTELLKVEEVGGGSTAADLNILGTAAKGKTTIDGSFEVRVEIDGDDTLRDVAAKINEAAPSVAATLISDGSPLDPFRLSIASKVGGTPGRILLDSGTTKLSFATMVEAQDAVVFFGGSDISTALPVISSSNTVTGLIEGLTLELTGTGTAPVSVTVSRDADKIVADIGTFVQTYNDVMDRIAKFTSFNKETMKRGLLFGDSTVDLVRTRLVNAMTASVPGADPSFSRLASVGITMGTGSRLQFDEARFRKALAENPEAVSELFTRETTATTTEGNTETKQVGFGYRIDAVLDALTTSGTGLLARQDDRLANQQELFKTRISYMNKVLERKRERLERQFQAMERSLSMLQQQSSSLSTLASLASGWSATVRR